MTALEGTYRLSAEEGGYGWASMFKVLTVKPDGTATYAQQDVADRDSSTETNHEGRIIEKKYGEFKKKIESVIHGTHHIRHHVLILTKSHERACMT